MSQAHINPEADGGLNEVLAYYQSFLVGMQSLIVRHIGEVSDAIIVYMVEQAKGQPKN